MNEETLAFLLPLQCSTTIMAMKSSGKFPCFPDDFRLFEVL
jgi:hypothetical protein